MISIGFKETIGSWACTDGMVTRVMFTISSSIRDKHTVFFPDMHKHFLNGQPPTKLRKITVPKTQGKEA